MVIRLSDMIPYHKVCCICFDPIPFEDLYIDNDGSTWDMCKPCGREQTLISFMLGMGIPRDQILKNLAHIRSLTAPPPN